MSVYDKGACYHLSQAEYVYNTGDMKVAEVERGRGAVEEAEEGRGGVEGVVQGVWRV